MEAFGAVELEILAGVEDIRAGDPEHDGGAEEVREGGAGFVWRDREPGADGGGGERKPEHEVAEGGEALGEGVAEGDGEGEGGEFEAQGVEHGGGQEEEADHDDGEGEGEADGESAGGDGAHPGAGVVGIEARIDGAVERHGGASGGDHGEEYPPELVPGGDAMGGIERGDQGPGQGEEGVLDLDHLQDGADAAEHRAILSGARSVDYCRSGMGYPAELSTNFRIRASLFVGLPGLTMNDNYRSATKPDIPVAIIRTWKISRCQKPPVTQAS